MLWQPVLEEMNYRWSIAPRDPTAGQRLSRQFRVSLLLAQCLINRGFEKNSEVEHFLTPQLRDLGDPMRLPQMEKAIDQLIRARELDQLVVIFGDYDVDGVTATALLIEIMQELGWRICSYLPHRIEEGYGLSQRAVANCLQRFSPDLLLAVDCGSTAVDSIQYLRDQGVDVIVLDHHQVGEPVPKANALVNPHLDGGAFCELSSVGLAFKLAHAIVKRCRQLNQPPAAHDYDLRPLLDLVALGTVADLVPLVGENRVMLTAGLKRLNQTQRPGLLALMEIAQVRDKVGVFEISFQLGPRLNAAGRLKGAGPALDLLLVDDLDEARRLASELDERNRERQQIEKDIADEAASSIRSQFDPEKDFVIVEGRVDWHVGVVGIVASRVLREFYRPTIILGGEGGDWRGSGRSVAGFDIAEALRSCDDLLVRHGGHAMAAGLSIDPDKLDAFRQRMNAYARHQLSKDCLVPIIRLDAEVVLSEMTVNRLQELSRLYPFGAGNFPLQFVARNLMLRSLPQRMGKDHQHAKFWVTDGNTSNEVLWWNCGSRSLPSGRFDLAFTPQINDYNGRRSVQFKLLDWCAAG